MADRNTAKIAEGLKKLNGTGEHPVLSGKCKSVDEANATMVVDLNGSEQDMEDVLLNALDGEANGLLIIPKIGTDVVICSVDGPGEYMLVSCGEVEKWILKSKEMSIEVESLKILCDAVEFNGGDNKGLVKVAVLTEKVNNLENKYNAILALLQGVVIPLAPTGTYPFAPLFAGETPLTPTQETELKNDKVKH